MSAIIDVTASPATPAAPLLVTILAPNGAPEVGARLIDTGRGAMNTRVSSQFWNRPGDQRFLSLDDLYAHTKKAADESFYGIINVPDIRCIAERENPDSLRLAIPAGENGRVVEAEPTHWSFGQLNSLLGTPAQYLRRLPAPLAAINLQYAVANFRAEAVKAFVRENGRTELRAATGPDYGRIFDHEIVAAVQRIAGNGTGDTHWKVPGLLDWSNMRYDPNHPISKQTTTLFASDRDVFIFLVDDLHPIEIGKLADGSPDYIFRGFIVANSEVGSKSLTVSTMYLRGICCNRILWGVEGYQEISLRHSKNAPMRFPGEVGPALESFANESTGKLLSGIASARDAVVARDDEARESFLDRQGFTKPQTKAIMASVLREEGKAPESVWDFVQGITAVARSIPHQDTRVDFERRAGRLLDKVAA